MLPAGFELENPNLSQGVRIDDINLDGKTVLELKERNQILHEQFLDDRYVAAIQLYRHYSTHLYYLARGGSPGVYSAPPAMGESMYRPEIRGIGESGAPITVVNVSQSGDDEGK